MRRIFRRLADGHAIFAEGCEVTSSSPVVEELVVDDLSDEQLEQVRANPSSFQISRTPKGTPVLKRVRGGV